MDTQSFPEAMAVLDFLQAPDDNQCFLPGLISQQGRTAVGWTISHVFNENLPLRLHSLSERDRGTVAAALLKYPPKSASAKDWARVCELSPKDIEDLDLIDLCMYRGERQNDSGLLTELGSRLAKRDDFAQLFNEQTSRTPWAWFLSDCQYANKRFICTLIDRSAVTSAFRDLDIGSKFDFRGMAPSSYTEIHTHIVKNSKNMDELYSKNQRFEIVHQILNSLVGSSSSHATSIRAAADNIVLYLKRLSSEQAGYQDLVDRINTRIELATVVSKICLTVPALKDSQAEIKKLCSAMSALSNSDYKQTAGAPQTLLGHFLATQVGYTPEGEQAVKKIAKELGVQVMDYRELDSPIDRDWKHKLLAEVIDNRKLLEIKEAQRRANLDPSGPGL